MNPETLFKLRVQKDLSKLQNTWFFKTQERSIRGIPDIIGSVAGRFFAAELKIDDEPTKLQQFILNQIKRTGAVSFSTTPEEWEEHMSYMRKLSIKIP